MEQVPQEEIVYLKLTYELRKSLGLHPVEENIDFKIIRKEGLAKKLKNLSITLPQLQDCKCDLIIVKIVKAERLERLKIFLTEESVEKEISSLNLETKNPIENEAETEIVIEEAEEISKRKDWICLGSEEEIILSHAPKQRPLQIIEAEVKTKGKKEKKTLTEKISDKRNFASFPQSKEKTEIVERKSMDVCVQVGEAKNAEAQTEINFPANMWVQWSAQTRDFEAEYSEQRKEHLKKWVGDKAEDLLDFAHHNSILENHTDDFQSLTNGDNLVQDHFAKENYYLSDLISSYPECKGVAIAHAWHPKKKDFIAVSYGETHKNAAVEEIGVCDELSENREDKSSHLFAEKIIIWDCGSGKPQFRLSSSFRVDCISFCPNEENQLIGGCCNGEIKIWKLPPEEKVHIIDETITKKNKKCRKPIIGLHWLTLQIFLTLSTDGSIIIWILDSEKIKETGVKFSVKSQNLFYATSSLLEIIVQQPNTNIRKDSLSDEEQHIFGILIGSHDGAVSFFKIDIKAKVLEADEEEEEAAPAEVCQETELDASNSPKMHDGPVSDFKQSPLEQNIFLSVGGQTFAIFSIQDEKLGSPLFLKRGSASLSSGCWSLYSKNIFYTFTNNGSLQVWNLLNRKSSLETQICLSPGYIKDLSYPDCNYQNGNLPMTDNKGSIIICKIPKHHQTQDYNSSDVFKREKERISFGEARLAPLQSSSKLKSAAKERLRSKRKEQELLETRMESLVKPERSEILVLREKAGDKDKATRTEAARRLALLDHLPAQLFALKRVDTKRLLEIQLPMIDLQKRQLRKNILRERRFAANSDFLK